MKQAAAATIPDERAKTRLLREQENTTSQSQFEIDELRAKLQAVEMEASQRSLQVGELKRELEHIRERY
jgi:hypothetical protein